MVGEVNGKKLEVLFGGVDSNNSTKSASEQAQSSKAAADAKLQAAQADDSAVKISVGEDKSQRVQQLKAIYAAGGDSALNAQYQSDDVAKALLG